MDLIRKVKTGYICISVLLIAAGLLLILQPELSALTVCCVTGGLIAVFGVIKLIGYFSKDLYRLAFQFDFALGIFALIAGILMLAHPADIVKTVPVIFGVFVVTDGAFKLQTARDAHLFGLSAWWGVLLLAAVTCIGGLLLIINPFEGAAALMTLLGANLIVDGLQNLIVVVCTVKAIRSEDEPPCFSHPIHSEKR